MECSTFVSVIIIVLAISAVTNNSRPSEDVRKVDLNNLELNGDKIQNGSGKDITKVQDETGVVKKEVDNVEYNVSDQDDTPNNESGNQTNHNAMVEVTEMENNLELNNNTDKREVNEVVEKSMVKHESPKTDKELPETESNNETEDPEVVKDGVLQSPNYPKNYRRNEDINKMVDLKELRNFTITMRNFSLEDNRHKNKGNCFDTFTLYKGRHQIKENILIGPICGALKDIRMTRLCSMSKDKLTMTCEFISVAFLLNFKTDGNGESTGYSLNYSSIVATHSQICRSMLDVVNHLKSNETVAISTSFLAIGNNYPRNMTCDWRIPHVPSTRFIDQITIKIIYFSIEESVTNSYRYRKSYDSVQIYRVKTSNITRNNTLSHTNTSEKVKFQNNDTYTQRKLILLNKFYGCTCPLQMSKFDVEQGIQVIFHSNAKKALGGFKLNIITKSKEREILRHLISVNSSYMTKSIHELVTNTTSLICGIHSICSYLIEFNAVYFGFQIHLEIIGDVNAKNVLVYDGYDRGHQNLKNTTHNINQYTGISYLSGGPFLTVFLLNYKAINSSSTMRFATHLPFSATSYWLRGCKVSGARTGILSLSKITAFTITRSKVDASSHFCYAMFVIPHGLHFKVDMSKNIVRNTMHASAIMFGTDKDVFTYYRYTSDSKVFKNSYVLYMMMHLYAKEGEHIDTTMYARISAVRSKGDPLPKLIDRCSRTENTPFNTIGDVPGFIDMAKYPNNQKTYYQKGCNVILALGTSDITNPQYIELYIHKYYGYKVRIREDIDRKFTKGIEKILTVGEEPLLLTHTTFKSVSTVRLGIELSNSIAQIEYQVKTYMDLPVVAGNISVLLNAFLAVIKNRNGASWYPYVSKQRVKEMDFDDIAYHNNHSYTLNNIDTLHNMTVAEELCMAQGGHLFSASTVAELESIKSLLATRWMENLPNISTVFWHDVLIGLQKRGDAGWRWTDGSPLTISDWYYPDILEHYIPPEIQNQRQDTFMIQPVEDRGYNCTMMGIHSPRQSTNWQTVDCDHIPDYVQLFICEIPDVGLKPDNVSANLQEMVRNTNEAYQEDDTASYKYEQFTNNITCPTNWTYIHGQCWLMLHTNVSQLEESNTGTHHHYHNIIDAKGGCREFGGQIADLTDLETVKKYMTYTQHHEEYGNVWVLHKGKPACVQYRLRRDLNHEETDRLYFETDVDKKCVKTWVIEQNMKKNKDKKYSEINRNYFPFHCNYESKPIVGADVEVYTAICYPNHVFCVRDVINITKTCQTGYLECNDNSCVSPDLMCDNRTDCPTGEDEENCDLDDYRYNCRNKENITISKYCDHVKDCRDGSDEEGCVYPLCSHGQFRCDNGQCVDGHKRCNGLRDGCVDLSDEAYCTRGHCANGFFCSEGCIRTCINEKRKNDGMSDCRYGVDEPHMSKYSKDYHIKAVEQNCSAEEGRCAVRNEGCFNRGDACVLGYGSDGRMKGCRDGTHLTDCSMFECPGRYKCPESYCIDMKQVCDGVHDCRFGEDEAECDDTRSPGLYRCGEKQTHSIDRSHVCDGQFDCGHYHSDEKYCSLPKCPQGCTCRGFYYNCEGNITDDISIRTDNFSSLARTLNLARNNLMTITNFNFSTFPFLATLRLAYNQISKIDNGTFRNLHNLRILDLRHNKLTSLGQEAFKHLGRLTEFLLEGNEIATLLPRTFIGMSQISDLNLSYLNIRVMRSEALRGLYNLKTLNLSGNTHTQIDRGVFNKSHKLKKVVLTNNTLSDTKYLKEVIGDISSKSIEAGTFRFCCFTNKTRTKKCTPNIDIYSSCADLMSNRFLQIAIWVIGCLAFVGNISVIIFRPIMGIKSPAEICIFALSCSDFLTGLYLVILASVDTYYRGKYIANDEKWRGSVLCQVCGVISTLSSQLSSFLLLLITLDRFIHLVFPMKGIRYSRRSTVIVCVVLFLFSLLSSIIPISIPEYFGNAYYSKTALCLAYDFTSRSEGWEYTVGMFISVNLFNCILTLVVYVTIFCSVRHSSKKSDPTRKGDIALAKTLFLLVLTDLVCWFPLIIASLSVITGGKVEPAMAAMLAVVVLPINAALNPYLYTISSVQNARSRRRTKRHDRKLLGQSSHQTAASHDSRANVTSRKTVMTRDSGTTTASQDGRKSVKQDSGQIHPLLDTQKSNTKGAIPKVCSIEDRENGHDTATSVSNDRTSTRQRRNQLMAVYQDSNDVEDTTTPHRCETKKDDQQLDEDGSFTIVQVHAEPVSAKPSSEVKIMTDDTSLSNPKVHSPNIKHTLPSQK